MEYRLNIANIVKTTLLARAVGQQGFETFLPEFNSILGPSPKLTLLKTVDQPLFHKAAVYYPPTRSLFLTSNQIDTNSLSPATNNKTIILSRVSGLLSPLLIEIETINAPGIPLANGGVRYMPGPDGQNDTLLFCAQGTKDANPPGGIIAMNAHAPYDTQPVVTSYYGKPFNSPNDVVVSKDGSIWFTDPSYGFEQGIRPATQLRNQVYRFDPKTNSTRAVADQFSRPNGLAFGVDEKTLYVTDTGLGVGDGTLDLSKPASIYALDIQTTDSGAVFAVNRRLFAYSTDGIPDGMKIDSQGNVYSGTGDGITVWNADGDLIGKILVDGGCSNFGFGEPGVIFILNEKRLFRADISSSVRDARPWY